MKKMWLGRVIVAAGLPPLYKLHQYFACKGVCFFQTDKYKTTEPIGLHMGPHMI